MGVATFLIGLLPTYASIGLWAPALLVLLRLAQGFGVGGEWGGAVLMAVEHSPNERRGFYGSWPQVGVPAGLLLSTAVFWWISNLPDAALFDWGWRVAFLVSILLVAVGLYIRLAVVEPPAFTALKQSSATARTPILDVLRHHPRNVLLAMGARIAENGAFYIYTVFILSYATQPRIGFSRPAVLAAISLAAVVEMMAIPAFGLLSDLIGRRPVYLFGAAFTALFAFPFFRLVESGRPVAMVLAVVVALAAGHAAMYGPQASFFSELFGTRVRYSGASLGYQLASVIAGGLSPLIATDLLRRTGASWPIALLIVAMAAVSMLSVFLARETAHGEMASHAAPAAPNE
jgi:MFS family permease